MKIILYFYRKYQKTSGPFRSFLIRVYHQLVYIRSQYRRIKLQIIGKPLLIRKNETDIAIFQSIFGANELVIFAPIKKSFNPKYIVDAGAYAGYSAVWYARTYPNASIIAIEPEASNFKVLSRNIQPYQNIQGVKKALWSNNNPVYVRDMGTGDWGFKMETDNTNSLETVDTVTIDQLIEQSPEKKIDILKIDIEGGEIDVLKNAHTWHDKVDVIMIELHDWFAPGCTEAYLEMKSHGDWAEYTSGVQKILIKRNLIE